MRFRSFQRGKEDSSKAYVVPKKIIAEEFGGGGGEGKTVLIIQTFYIAWHCHLHYFWHENV